jgi:hypothetical protein
VSGATLGVAEREELRPVLGAMRKRRLATTLQALRPRAEERRDRRLLG